MTIKMKFSGEKKLNSDEESRINIFVRQMLTTRIFSASYIGRFYVDTLKAYRDVLQINGEEKNLSRDLETIKKRVDNFYQGSVWAAITEPGTVGTPSGFCIWVQLQNVPFGSYWFMIEDVKLSEQGEVIMKIKVVRNLEKESNSIKRPISSDASISWAHAKKNVIEFVQETLTWHNIKEGSKFMFALVMTLVTVMLYVLQYLGDYSLCLFKEFNNFIKVSTPVFIAVLDMITKTIGGFYILLAMLWRGNNQAPPPLLSLKAPSHGRYRPIQQRSYRKGQDL